MLAKVAIETVIKMVCKTRQGIGVLCKIIKWGMLKDVIRSDWTAI